MNHKIQNPKTKPLRRNANQKVYATDLIGGTVLACSVCPDVVMTLTCILFDIQIQIIYDFHFPEHEEGTEPAL